MCSGEAVVLLFFFIMYIIASAFKNMGPNIQVLTTPIPTPAFGTNILSYDKTESCV